MKNSGNLKGDLMKKNEFLKTVSAICILTTLSGCAIPELTTNPISPGTGAAKSEGTDWDQCFLRPTGSFQPGLIFRRARGAKEGAKAIEIRPAQKAPNYLDAASTNYTIDRNFSAGFIAENLALGPLALGSAGLGGGKTYNVEMIVKGASEEIIYENDIQDAEQYLLSLEGRRVVKRYSDTDDFYIVRKAYLASGLTLKMASGVAAEFGGNVSFQNKIGVKGWNYKTCRPTADGGEECVGGKEDSNSLLASSASAFYSIDQTFSNPLRMCIDVQKLRVVTDPTDPDRSASFEFVDVTINDLSTMDGEVFTPPPSN